MTRSHSQTCQLRALVRRGARRVGKERQLLRVYEALFRAIESPAVGRNRRDDEQVRCLAAAVPAESSNCTDIGAKEGHLLAVFAELAPRGRRIAYEPVPELSKSLARECPQIDAPRAAVSDYVGETTFVVNVQLPSGSGLRSGGYPSEHTETIRTLVATLESALPPDHLPHCLKVDVEAAEHLVLQGGGETLRAHKRTIIFEHQNSTASHYGTGPDKIFALLLDELDMRIVDMDAQGPYSLRRLQEVYENGSRWNYFAVSARRLDT